MASLATFPSDPLLRVTAPLVTFSFMTLHDLLNTYSHQCAHTFVYHTHFIKQCTQEHTTNTRRTVSGSTDTTQERIHWPEQTLNDCMSFCRKGMNWLYCFDLFCERPALVVLWSGADTRLGNLTFFFFFLSQMSLLLFLHFPALFLHPSLLFSPCFSFLAEDSIKIQRCLFVQWSLCPLGPICPGTGTLQCWSPEGLPQCPGSGG